MRTIRIALAQINPTVGAFTRNARKILAFAAKARSMDVDLVLFPELVVTGYPPEDLLLKPGFIADNLACLQTITSKLGPITVVVGFVDRDSNGIYNAAAVIHDGVIAAVYRKMFLPNYGVFDEQRYFRVGHEALNLRLNGVTVGLEICEDIWRDDGPARLQAEAGAEIIVNINASPYHAGKCGIREELLCRRSIEHDVSVAYVNAVGGQDELIFDGQSIITGRGGKVVSRGRPFVEDLIIADIDAGAEKPRRVVPGLRVVELPGELNPTRRPLPARHNVPALGRDEEVLKALTLGTVDYVKKNGFKHVCIGLSGGIDSALVAAIAAAALGHENVTGVFMPSRYTSNQSLLDAKALAKNLDIAFMTIPIEEVFERYNSTLRRPFKDCKPGIAEENLQARIRGNLLMALSNKFGWLVLTTGNKSEMSVGYATLYGDMAGGFAVIKDLPKTMVYDTAAAVNKGAGAAVIPLRVFTKAPTAELRPNQTDQDTLPPYALLDAILKAYVEEDKTVDEIASSGFDRAIVKKVVRMVDRSEYKRRQAPPGIKITPRALGKDRRMPITNGYGEGGLKK